MMPVDHSPITPQKQTKYPLEKRNNITLKTSTESKIDLNKINMKKKGTKSQNRAHRGFVPKGKGGGEGDSLPPFPLTGVDLRFVFLAGGGGGGGFRLFNESISIFELCLLKFGCGGGGGAGCGAPTDALSAGCDSKYEPMRSVIRCFLLNSVSFCLPVSMCSLLRCRKLFVDGGNGAALRVVSGLDDAGEVGVLS